MFDRVLYDILALEDHFVKIQKHNLYLMVYKRFTTRTFVNGFKGKHLTVTSLLPANTPHETSPNFGRRGSFTTLYPSNACTIISRTLGYRLSLNIYCK
jgi:hypothetical protein